MQNQNAKKGVGLLRTLVRKNLITQADATQIEKDSELDSQVSLIDVLIRSEKISALALAQFTAQTFSLPLLDLYSIDKEFLPTNIDKKVIAETEIVPIRWNGNRLSIAIVDPTDRFGLERFRFTAQAQLEPIVVEYTKLSSLIKEITQQENNDVAQGDGGHSFGFSNESLIDKEEDATEEQKKEKSSTTAEVDDAPLVRFLQKVLVDAIDKGASDIHFEPYEKFYRIRFRIDGQLSEISSPPLAIKDKLASRIKVISRLNISEKRVPQDGRMKLILSNQRAIDFRVSTLPTLFGEKIVMRILDPSSAKLGIEALGYEDAQKEALLNAIKRPYGMTLVTGPTGSGKTVSLYTCLNILNDEGINISTAEDPAEINLPGINQVNVNDKAGLTFSSALKSFLRQDPDIIMVGEIRDLETADIAIKAAQTGHMVLSTLHTNDAPATLSRLANMGVAPFNIASSIILITAQRLARRLCSHCKAPIKMDKKILLDLGFIESDFEKEWQAFQAVGCEKCNSGYKGRVGIYQVMPISEEMQKIILANGNALQIAKQAKLEGVDDLRRSGFLKIIQGSTSIEEVMSVTNQ